MIKVKDTKLSADIEDDATQYVTFWGKLKGDIDKQEDLVNLVEKNVNKLSADVKDEFKRISEKVLEIKYDDDLLNVDEVDANKDKLTFKASNKASGNVQDITLLRKEAVEQYIDDKMDEIADFVYHYILSKGVVDDPDYNHTDNNYTNNDRAKVSLVPEIQSGLVIVQSDLAQCHETLNVFINEIAETERKLVAAEENIAILNDKSALVDQEIEAINTSIDKQIQDIDTLKISVKDIYPVFEDLDENEDYALRLVNTSQGWCFVWVPVEASEY